MNNITNPLDNSPQTVIDLDLLNRYVLHLPMPPGSSHAQIARQMQSNTEVAEIVSSMLKDHSALLDLRQGWFGYKGAILSGLQQERVSRDLRLQRAWENLLEDDPDFARRVSNTARLFNWPSLFRGSALVFAGSLCMAFVIGRSSIHPGVDLVEGPDKSHSSASQNGGTDWAPAQYSLSASIRPADSALPSAILKWRGMQDQFPDDRIVRLQLLRLYDRALHLSADQLFVESKTLDEYRKQMTETKQWLRDHPDPSSSGMP